jgi:transcriptional regulator with XRE-family HTH domain
VIRRDNVSKFGDRLKLLRKERLKTDGLTQEKLGNMFNVEKGTVSNWENGNRTPDLQIVSKLADLFNVSADYLIGRTDIRNYNKLTREDMIKLAPEFKKLFEEEGLKSVEVKKVSEDTKDISNKELANIIVEAIEKSKHLNKE